MKILYIANVRLPTDNAHGLQIMKTCEALANAGASVTLLHPWRINTIKADPFDFYKVKRNFRLVTVPSPDTLAFGAIGFWFQNAVFGLGVFVWLLFLKYDVVYSRDELPLYCATFVARNTVWESHTGRYNGLIKRLLIRISKLVTITRAGAAFYEEKGVSPLKILTAHDAVSLEDFSQPQDSQESRKRLSLPADMKIVLYIGKLEGWKGVETLCAAAGQMPDDVRVAVVGGESGEIAELKKKYPKVTFLGWRPYSELADNQAAADVLILPNSATSEISARFTSPLKLFTYMASGKPIVASDLESLREVLDETSAYWFKPDDAGDLALKIEYALAHVQESAEKARIAATEVVGYTWEARGKAILAHLQKTT